MKHLNLMLLTGSLLALLNLALVGCALTQPAVGKYGAVEDDACRGVQACLDNFGYIETDSCNGNYACQFNVSVIGSKECNKDNECRQVP